MERINTEKLWTRLASEGNFDLINKLHRAEQHEPGFETIVVKKEGFSDNDTTHNMVLQFLRERKINIVNPILEKARLRLIAKECLNKA